MIQSLTQSYRIICLASVLAMQLSKWFIYILLSFHDWSFRHLAFFYPLPLHQFDPVNSHYYEMEYSLELQSSKIFLLCIQDIRLLKASGKGTEMKLVAVLIINFFMFFSVTFFQVRDKGHRKLLHIINRPGVAGPGCSTNTSVTHSFIH